MISKALEQREEGGRVSHSWCVCAACHGYGELGGGMDAVGGWYACGQSLGVGHMSGFAAAHPGFEVKKLVTPDHTTVQLRNSE